MYIQDFDFNVDLLRAILWQYNDAGNLQGILSRKQAWYERNQAAFWSSWVRDVFSLETANDFGLAVWGFILDESRDSFISGARADYPAFGFTGRRNFSRGNFRRTHAGFVRLGQEQYRTLLRLRYYKLTSRGTVSEINAFLEKLFAGQGKAYVLDGQDMSLTYVFSFAPASWQLFVLQDMDALPRPTGVGVKLRVIAKRGFGFGSHHANFNGGTFAA